MPKFEPDEVWFTSDTHFNHKRIIEFSNRPFADVPEMNEELIRRWNDTVPPDGVVFHLGDFAFGKAPDWRAILDQLHGRIYLVMGNHDYRNYTKAVESRFVKVAQQMSIRVGNQPIILNHNPFLCYGGAYDGTWQLFGHVHSGPRGNPGQDIPRLVHLFPTQYDVGVDNNDFRPVSYSQVKARIEEQINQARSRI